MEQTELLQFFQLLHLLVVVEVVIIIQDVVQQGFQVVQVEVQVQEQGLVQQSLQEQVTHHPLVPHKVILEEHFHMVDLLQMVVVVLVEAQLPLVVIVLEIIPQRVELVLVFQMLLELPDKIVDQIIILLVVEVEVVVHQTLQQVV
tara:strand:- start:102 stop:536 length:435 start_codon:yes stop_codon:yes gene_type:complete